MTTTTSTSTSTSLSMSETLNYTSPLLPSKTSSSSSSPFSSSIYRISIIDEVQRQHDEIDRIMGVVGSSLFSLHNPSPFPSASASGFVADDTSQPSISPSPSLSRRGRDDEISDSENEEARQILPRDPHLSACKETETREGNGTFRNVTRRRRRIRALRDRERHRLRNGDGGDGDYYYKRYDNNNNDDDDDDDSDDDNDDDNDDKKHEEEKRLTRNLTSTKTNDFNQYKSIKSTYHTSIIQSKNRWTLYTSSRQAQARAQSSKSLSKSEQLDLRNLLLMRFVMGAWKRLSWFRMLRIKKGRSALLFWRRVCVTSLLDKAATCTVDGICLRKTLTRVIKGWKGNVERIQRGRCRSLDSKAWKHLSNKSLGHGIREWKNNTDTNVNITTAHAKIHAKIRGLYNTILLHRYFFLLKTRADGLQVIRLALIKRTINMLKNNVTSSCALRFVCNTSLAFYRRYKLKSGWMWLRGNLRMKDQRDLISLKPYLTALHKLTVRVKRERDEMSITACLHYEHYLHTLVKRCFSTLKQSYEQSTSIINAGVSFNMYKCKRCLRKFQSNVTLHRLLDVMNGRAESKYVRMVLRMCFNSLSLKKKIRGIGVNVQRLRRKRMFAKWSFKFRIHTLRNDRYKRSINLVFTALRVNASERRRGKTTVNSFIKRYIKYSVLSSVSVYGKAVAYYNAVVLRNVKKRMFIRIRMYVVKLKKRVACIHRVSHSYRNAVMECAVKTWRCNVQRLAWHDSSLMCHWQTKVRKVVAKVIATWRDNVKFRIHSNALNTKSLQCHRGRTLSKAFDGMKLYCVIMLTKRAMYELSIRQCRRRRIKAHIKHWASTTQSSTRSKHLLNIGRLYYHIKQKAYGLKALKSSTDKSRIYKVCTTLSYYIYRKNYIQPTFTYWVSYTHRRVILNRSITRGIKLMKVLAFKRWLSGSLHVKLRNKVVRRLFNKWKVGVRRVRMLVEFGVKRRFFLSFKSNVNFRVIRNKSAHRKVERVQRLRVRNVMRDWRMAWVGSKHWNTRGLEIRVRRVLRFWRGSAVCYKSLIERWRSVLNVHSCDGDGGGDGDELSVVKKALYDLLLSSFTLRTNKDKGKEKDYDTNEECNKWKGTVKTQRLHLQFTTLRHWYTSRIIDNSNNQTALTFWRMQTLTKAYAAWKNVKFERLRYEGKNEDALNLWYTALTYKTLTQWRMLVTSRRTREDEVNFNKTRAGFDTFVSHLMKRKVKIRKVHASHDLNYARSSKLLQIVMLAWAEYTQFAILDLKFTQQRLRNTDVMLTYFLLWRIFVKSVVLPRLVHLSRSKSGVDVSVGYVEGFEGGVRELIDCVDDDDDVL